MNALDSRNESPSFNMQNELSLAVKEGIMEKAGPVYQFTHDILQQTIYELIPSHNRTLLHKRIGKSLLKFAADNPTIHLLATDQINIFCEDGNANLEERSQFAPELLTTSFSQLSSTLMRTVKMLSCLGSQVEESTINALVSRNEVLSFNMQNELALAVKEGIMEKAGPVYQFTHDIIQQTIYELIPSHHRKLLHKAIGKDLLKSAANDSTMHLLATDQINLFCKDGDPSLEECSQFAISNATAAKFA
eukprot:CAMPEP_0201946684 /NCGR_PEP_ID=MMETSP0903-20130614/54545_1 /ASSEMBLY_ACC=CAM_ASM_000552 /TAXON_ID=420261 /ORGANISM="Thalassiosira antarctica, Strain CCMP982" /LENGTH=247 /DNA_ID=CAMNT_0048489789 /DNA_START=286 /DNA_END=1026 /DNA_ORIENTATION=+